MTRQHQFTLYSRVQPRHGTLAKQTQVSEFNVRKADVSPLPLLPCIHMQFTLRYIERATPVPEIGKHVPDNN